MDSANHPTYTQDVAERLRKIIELTGLEVPGFAAFIGLSESHVYSLLSARREIPTQFAQQLGEQLDFDGIRIFKLNQELPESIRTAPALRKFRKEHHHNKEYFITTKKERSLSHFLEEELLHTSLFEEPRYVWQVNDACREKNRKVDSDTLSKHLKYLVSKNLLKSAKKQIQRRDGSLGKRMVTVFFKPD